MVETIRVLYDQYHAPAVGFAMESQVKNNELIVERQNKTKAVQSDSD